MRQPTGTWFLLTVAAGALAACADTKPPQIDANLFPSAVKKEIVDTLIETLGDPTNVRDAYISEPVLTPVENDQRYTVCVRFNPRDANQHYMGSTERIGFFYGGHLNQLIAATKAQCGNTAYKPFPELEKICLGAKCL
jgi:hypothetical protein